MPSNCVFRFERSNLVYYSGETVSGSIILTTTSNTSVNGKVFRMCVLILKTTIIIFKLSVKMFLIDNQLRQLKIIIKSLLSHPVSDKSSFVDSHLLQTLMSNTISITLNWVF